MDQNQVPDFQMVPDPQLQVPWLKMKTYLNALSLLLRSPCVKRESSVLLTLDASVERRTGKLRQDV